MVCRAAPSTTAPAPPSRSRTSQPPWWSASSNGQPVRAPTCRGAVRPNARRGPHVLPLDRPAPARGCGDRVLTESAACVLPVAERFPDARLVPPAGTRGRSEVYRGPMFMPNTRQPAFLHWFYPERYTVDPAGEEPIRRLAARSIAEHLERLDAELAARPWLVGEKRSGADLFLFMRVR